MITEFADKRGLDPDLVAAVIFQESGGRADVIAFDGGVGLMQIMSCDGVSGQLYGSLFADRPTVEELLKPRKNISYGTRMLADEIHDHGLQEGLRRYNGNAPYSYYANKVLAIYYRYRS